MHRRADLPPALTIGPFRTSEARAEGVSAKRLRSRDVVQPFRGVNIAGPIPETVMERAHALAPLLRPSDAFSHSTAARLLGAPLPRSIESDPRLHVTTVGGDDRIRRRGVIGHATRGISIEMLGVLPIVAPPHVFWQLATEIGHDHLVAVGDFFVTPPRTGTLRVPAIASIDDLLFAIPARGRGSGCARRAVRDVRIGAESPMETRLRLLLRRAGLPEPQLNPAVDVGDGILHPDLLFPEWRVVLEYEGDGHRTDQRQWRRDIARREAFESAGWRVIRVHRDDVLAEPEAFLARLCRILAQRQRDVPGR